MTTEPPSLTDVIKDEDDHHDECDEDSETDTEAQACIPTPSKAKIRSKWFKAVKVISGNSSNNVRYIILIFRSLMHFSKKQHLD